MTKKVFISGVNGNMGQRYALICKKLGYKVYGCSEDSFMNQAFYCKDQGIDRVIIATPTYSHLDAIFTFRNICNFPILCEKPIDTQPFECSDDSDFNLTMVNQYAYLVDKDSIGPSYYSYFKTGKDGLYWDCINIIGLAKQDIIVSNESHVWTCAINGQALSIADMDNAYYLMLEDWLQNPVSNLDYIISSHKKVVACIEKYKKEAIEEYEEPKKPDYDTKIIPFEVRS